ncbi:Isochorismatase-like protein [Gloeopeniophorella convolvens]|nr:Isochorismatase-like protein [Gloeopeniophorella convolvens]
MSNPADSSAEPTPRRILLVSDVQADMLWDPPAGLGAPAHAVLANVERVLLAARGAARRPRIVHVRNCGGPGATDERGAPGWELVLPPAADEPVLDKTTHDAFASTELSAYVPVDADFVVVGFQSDFCVRATCRAALVRGNRVFIVKGAHGTETRSAEAEIEDELTAAGVSLLSMDEALDLVAAA